MKQPSLTPDWKKALDDTEYFWEPSIGKFHNKTLGRGMPLDRILSSFTPESWVDFHKSSMEEYNQDPEKYKKWRSEVMAKRQGCSCALAAILLVLGMIAIRWLVNSPY